MNEGRNKKITCPRFSSAFKSVFKNLCYFFCTQKKFTQLFLGEKKPFFLENSNSLSGIQMEWPTDSQSIHTYIHTMEEEKNDLLVNFRML